MSDQTKYINAYVDTAVGILHEQLNLFLQTKAQLKVANDIIQEKDAIIATLQNQLATKTDEFNITNHSLMEARHWESEYNSMKNKVSHMETLTNQLVDMKRMIQERDKKIEELENPVLKNRDIRCSTFDVRVASWYVMEHLQNFLDEEEYEKLENDGESIIEAGGES